MNCERFNKVAAAIALLQEFKNEIENQESSSDSEEELMLVKLVTCKAERGHVVRIQNYMESVVAAYNEKQFQEAFRLTRNAFEFVFKDVAEHCKDESYDQHEIDLGKQLLAVIWLLATPDSYRSVGERFNLPKSTLSMCFVRIINALNKIAPKHIKWPSGSDLVRTKNNFEEISSFKGLVGIVDGTYVRIKAPKAEEKSYTNRKCYTSMTLQCICDSEMRYIDCYTGWPSSVPDIRIFKNSDFYLRCLENEKEFFPNGEYILGDKAYPCNSWCIPPFMRRSPLTNAQSVFNKKHASVRVLVENSFALLFGRFRRLRDLNMNRIDWIPSTILACCVLHNICLNFNEESRAEYIEEGHVVLEHNHFEQNDIDREISAEDGNCKRNRICREINN